MVEVQDNTHFHRDYTGDLTITGEVHNKTASYVEATRITANIYDNQQLVLTEDSGTFKTIIPPNTKACFKISTRYSGPYSKITFNTPSYTVSNDQPAILSLFNVTRSTDSFGEVRVLGILKNSSGSTTEHTRAIGTFYNSAGKAIDCEYAWTINATLWPNQFGTFDLTTSTQNSLVNDYELQTDLR